MMFTQKGSFADVRKQFTEVLKKGLLQIEALSISHIELFMQLMVETKSGDFNVGSPVVFDGGKTWTVLNVKADKSITELALMFYD